jgi:hypothetical protein
MRDDGWDMSQEREFLENLLCQRFNFFLVVFGGVVAGVVGTHDEKSWLIVLWSGAIVLWLMTRTLWRAQYKLNLIFDDLKATDPEHPAVRIDRKAGGFSARNLIGYWIPIGCSLVTTAAIVLVYLGVVVPTSPAP